MLLYKGGKFHTHGVAFTIPDGFLVEPAPDAIPQNGFVAYTPDQRYIVEWDVEQGCHGTKEELEELFSPRRHIHTAGAHYAPVGQRSGWAPGHVPLQHRPALGDAF